MTLMHTKRAVSVKVLHPKYVEQVAELDAIEFGPEAAWDQEVFRSAFGFVALDEYDELLGYLIYVPTRSMIMLSRVCVRYTSRRTGVGTALLDRLKDKLLSSRREAMGVYAHEDNLDFQLFLKANSWLATRVIESNYLDGRAAYVFFWGRKKRKRVNE